MSGPQHEVEVDAALRAAMSLASDGIDYDEAKQAIADAITAVGKQTKALAAADYAGMKPQDIARSLSHSVKAVDEVYRLLQFAKGAPDSRPDVGQDWLRGLTEEQLRVVAGWIEERERRG